MKISYRILFINFFVVALIIGSASFAFYSIMYNVLTSQQSKYLLKSSNDFLLAYKETFQETENDFMQLSEEELFSSQRIKPTTIDFILEGDPRKPKYFTRSIVKEGVSISINENSFEKFYKDNPSVVIKKHTYANGSTYYYGRLLTDDFLNSIAQKINAQVAIITGNSTLQVSNQSSNQQFIYFLNKAYYHLAKAEKFKIYSEESGQADIISTLCTTTSSVNENQNLSFLVFAPLNEAADLRSSIKYIFLTVGVAGVLLSLILTFMFTQRIRNQLSLLSNATKLTKQGNFKNKIEIQSNDEIGQLAFAFNTMLDELDKHDHNVKEYADFIALINKNPSLKEIADAALNKIIKTCSFAVGAIYSVKSDSIALIRSYGIKTKSTAEDFELFESAIKNKEIQELNFEKSSLTVSSAIISFELKYLLIVPILFNNEVIAIIELGGVEKPTEEVKEYLTKIQEPLAIGLTNAFAFVQLENFVVELKLLNEEYQKQNNQIKQQNEALIKLHDQLKEKASELEFQKSRAEESTKLKSQFLASMSHELRTPMNSVLGLTELMLEETSILTPKTKERLEIVHRSGKRLMNLINDILDLSKIEAGKMEIKNDETLLEDIILDVEASIKPLALKKRLELKINRKVNTNIYIETDRGKVTQVLINLLGNAIKFTEKGFVELQIAVESERYLRFDIIDSGIGISIEDQKIIFEEFRQIDGTTTRKYGGTGLGLSICKRIAEMLNGSLSVDSQINRGSVFSFTIPLKVIVGMQENDLLSKNDSIQEKMENSYFVHEEKNVEIRLDELKKLGKEVEAITREEQLMQREYKGEVLVVDDDPDTLFTIIEIVKSCGCKVLSANNGSECLDVLSANNPDLILLDIM
ncbi:MAG: HAMP domain-containing protein, partial [Ignavibacteriaceae bacterium]|nr:HAMP domain-containing protein [Ignavibacteriaceae bacterium]